MTVIDFDKAKEKKDEKKDNEVFSITPKGWFLVQLMQREEGPMHMEEFDELWKAFRQQILNTAIKCGCDENGIPTLVFEEGTGGVPITI